MNKLPVVLEFIWLVLAVCCVGLGIHATVKHGFVVGRTFFILAILALLMFYIRRRRRINSK